MRLSTKYGEKTIEFEVSYRNRRTLAIQVEPLEKILVISPVLDYIVVHEMSHLIQRNHSPGFWKLVEFIIPDYKDRKKWLRDYGVRMDL